MKSLMHVVGATLLASTLFASAAHAEPAKLKPLTEAEVLKLVELTIDDQAIIDRLKKGGGVDFKVDDAVIDHLKKAGASDAVLGALKGVFPSPDQPAPDKVIASGQHDSGVVLEVTDIKRTSDGFLMVNFRYRNPTKKPILVYDGGFALGLSDAFHMIDGIHYVDPASKQVYGIVKVGVVPESSKVFKDGITAPAEGIKNLWVKMAAPDDDKVQKVTFYFRDVPPLEDVQLPPVKK